MKACREQNPKFEFLDSSWEGAKPHFDLLVGVPYVRENLLAGKSVEEIKSTWIDALKAFEEKRQKSLLYEKSLKW